MVVLEAVTLRSKVSAFSQPFVITSEYFVNHKARGYHPECPERISKCLEVLEDLKINGQIALRKIDITSSTDEALAIIKKVHCPKYVERVRNLVNRGAPRLSATDEDTYINSYSFNQSLLAQLAWLNGVDHVIETKGMAFSASRPPGHHASFDQSMGFCIFNFAVGAAIYAIERYNINRIGIIDFDVHYGNGVADLIKSSTKIRYTSIHELGIFPIGRGGTQETGDNGNILNIPLKYGAKFDVYEKLLREKAIPFIKEFNPELVIICAGYDALSSDELSNILLKPDDYQSISEILKESFGSSILFGLEGGYNLRDLPLAMK
eukprot:gene28590-37775_t